MRQSQETKVDLILRKLQSNKILAFVIVIGMGIIAFGHFTGAINNINNFIKNFSFSPAPEVITVDGKVYGTDFTQPLSRVEVNIVDDADNPLSPTAAVTGTDGKFVIKAKINMQAPVFLSLRKENCEVKKVPLNKEKLADLQIRYFCKVE